MNWGECKLTALQKIDPAVKNLNPTNATKDYLNAIVGVANRGLQDLCTAGKFIVKSVDIVQSEPKNILPDTESLLEIFTKKTEFNATGATSYYFEMTKNGKVQIFVGDEMFKEIEATELSTDESFKVFKGFISNEDKKPVKLVFCGDFHYMYRNIALYDTKFKEEEEIWDFVSEKRYDMKKLVTDFYKLSTTDIVYQSGYSKTRYEKTSDYFWEGDSVLVLNGFAQGSWKVHYFAYPQEITIETPDDTELILDREVASLLPVFMAAELLEDDDKNDAFYVRQEYEEAKRRLIPSRTIGKATFVDVNGW